MNLLTKKMDGTVILHLKEERLDAHNSGEFKNQILRLLEKGDVNFVVDLGEVRFIDSSGLGALLSGYKNTALHEGRFALSGLQSQVQSLFELTRLHRVFEIYPSLQEALDKG